MQKLSSEIDAMPKISNAEPKSCSTEVSSMAVHQVSLNAAGDGA